eukprot:5848236-Pyramimonas_sp.AAC.1
MFGRKQVTARLELLVVGRRSETRTSRGPSELSLESSGCVLGASAWLKALQAVLRHVVAFESWE